MAKKKNKGKTEIEELLTDEKLEEMQQKADILQREYELAKNDKEKWNAKFDRADDVFLGDRVLENTKDEPSDVAKTVMKLAMMMVEQQVDLNVPDPIFKPVKPDDEKPVKSLQEVTQYIIRSNDVEKMNSEVERDCKKYGTSIYKILWDNTYRQAGQKGKPRIISVHPKNILYSSGTIDEDLAECIFHAENRTLISCLRQYGDKARLLIDRGQMSDETLDMAGTYANEELRNTNDVDNSYDASRRNMEHPYTKYEIVEKWYRDEEGDIGLTTFSKDVILEEQPKFYYGRKYNKKTQSYETNDAGEPVVLRLDELGKDYKRKDTKIIKKGEQVGRYIPTDYPFISQKNIPRSKCPWGVSDVDILYDLEQSIKKIWYKAEDRLLNGTTKILYNADQEPDFANLYNNKDLQAIPVKDVNNIKIVDLKADDSFVFKYFDTAMDMLQRTIGVNNVWQGVNQGESTSGKMTEMLINQTAQQISKKIYEKNIAYKNIYKRTTDFIMAFGNGTMAYRIETGTEAGYGEFNKYELLRRNEEDEWVYPDWDIEISAGASFPKTAGFMFNSILQLAGGKFFEPVPTNLLVWKLLKKIGYPNAESIMQDLEDRMKQAQAQPQGQPPVQGQPQAQAQAQAQPQEPPQEESAPTQGAGNNSEAMAKAIESLPPEIRAAFEQMPVEEQAKAMGGLM